MQTDTKSMAEPSLAAMQRQLDHMQWQLAAVETWAARQRSVNDARRRDHGQDPDRVSALESHIVRLEYDLQSLTEEVQACFLKVSPPTAVRASSQVEILHHLLDPVEDDDSMHSSSVLSSTSVAPKEPLVPPLDLTGMSGAPKRRDQGALPRGLQGALQGGLEAPLAPQGPAFTSVGSITHAVLGALREASRELKGEGTGHPDAW